MLDILPFTILLHLPLRVESFVIDWKLYCYIVICMRVTINIVNGMAYMHTYICIRERYNISYLQFYCRLFRFVVLIYLTPRVSFPY